MKPPAANSVSLRCAHRTVGGRQCRLSASDARSGLCPQHRAEQKQVEAADYYRHLTTNFQFFQTAQGINYSLMDLYQLLAQNRISPRRAAVLSYISSLLLRTLPAIDADNAVGITDPTKPSVRVSLRDEDADTDEDDEDSEADEDADADEDSDTETETETETAPDTPLDSTNTWDPSIPEPDPKKKPS